MSAYIVSKRHIDFLVHAAICYGRPGRLRYGEMPVEYVTADRVGRDLWRENCISVAYRYPDCAPDDLPGPVPTPDPEEYEYADPRLGFPKPVAVLAALDCLEYQSCEHPGWRESAAHEFCRSLRLAAIRHLPGYDDAEWEIR